MLRMNEWNEAKKKAEQFIGKYKKYIDEEKRNREKLY